MFMVGLTVGVFLMLILLYCFKRNKEKNLEASKCERARVNGNETADSTLKGKMYMNKCNVPNVMSTEYRNRYHNQKYFKVSTINHAKINDKNNLTSGAYREKKRGRHDDTIQNHVTDSKLKSSILRPNKNGHLNGISCLSSLNRTRRLFDTESGTLINGVQPEMNGPQHKNDGPMPGAFGSKTSKRLEAKKDDGAVPVTTNWQRDKMPTLQAVDGIATDTEDRVLVMSVNPNSALGIKETPPSNKDHDLRSSLYDSDTSVQRTVLVVRSDGRGLRNLFTAVANHDSPQP